VKSSLGLKTMAMIRSAAWTQIFVFVLNSGIAHLLKALGWQLHENMGPNPGHDGP